MPCTACMTSYSLLRKEQACANCGYGFCSNCLRHSWMFPTLSKKALHVCASCHRQLTEAEQRIQEKTRNRGANGNWWGDEVLPPPSMRNNVPVMASSWKGGSGGGLRSDAQPQKQKQPQKTQPESQTSTEALRARLDKLKDEVKPAVRPLTTQELEERFAALREVSVEEVRHPGKMFMEGGGKQEETAEELIKRINDERELEEKWNPNQRHCVDRPTSVEKPELGEPVPAEVVEHKSKRGGLADDFDISHELDAVKKILQKCDSSEKPTDPAEHKWKNDEYDMKKILGEVKQMQEKDKKINRVLSLPLDDDSDVEDDASLNEDVERILREAQQADEEACKLVRDSQTENPPPPQDPNTSPQKKSGFFSRIFKK